MEKVIMAAAVVLRSFTGNAQESKGYLGMSFGSSTLGGDATSNFENGRNLV